jgi:transcriptional regulator with XRE-family HTH domain
VSGVRLEHELARRGWSALDLARAARLSPATVSAARRGRRVHASTLRRMVLALHKAPIVEGLEDFLDPATPD